MPEVPWWPLPVVALTGLGLYAMRQRAFQAVAGSEPAVRVLDRVALDGRSHAVLIEARASDGSLRRILVGTGSGAPRLITDLGIEGPSFEQTFDLASDTEQSEAQRLMDQMLGPAGAGS